MGSLRKAVTLIGAGTQGRRLAFMWLTQGRPVHLVDKNEQQLSAAKREIETYRNESQISSNVKSFGEVITGTMDDLPEAISNSWLALECVPESLSLKKETIQQMDGLADTETIVTSNSSNYTIEEILQDLPVAQPDRCVNLHSYWPPETNAIEIMGIDKTKPSILELLQEETRNHGFEPFLVHKSSTDYIYNRIWAAIKRETLLTIAEGVASPKKIDAIFKNVLKTPKGPCEQIDVVGLDVVRDIEQHYADARFRVPEEPRTLLKKMIAENKLGVKSGTGFYDYK